MENVINLPTKVYFGIYTFDGKTWATIGPDMDIQATKRRLKSVLPEPYRFIASEWGDMFKNVQCGIITLPLNILDLQKAERTFFPISDFIENT